MIVENYHTVDCCVACNHSSIHYDVWDGYWCGITKKDVDANGVCDSFEE